MAGDFLLEYKGEVIDAEEGETRLKQAARHESFIYFFEISGRKKKCIDASHSCGMGRYVNDSNKLTNCKMKRIDIKGAPHLCLFAVRDIQLGEQLFYDYGDNSDRLFWRNKIACPVDQVPELSADSAHFHFPMPSDDLVDGPVTCPPVDLVPEISVDSAHFPKPSDDLVDGPVTYPPVYLVPELSVDSAHFPMPSDDSINGTGIYIYHLGSNHCVIGQTLSFTVDITNATINTPLPLEVTVTGPCGFILSHYLNRLEDTHIVVDFDAELGGIHEAHVACNNCNVTGSPLKFTVLDPAHLTVQGDGLGLVRCGLKSSFAISMPGAVLSDISVCITGADGKQLTPTIVVISENCFGGSYVPLVHGDVLIEVICCGSRISSWLAKACDISKVNIYDNSGRLAECSSSNKDDDIVAWLSTSKPAPQPASDGASLKVNEQSDIVGVQLSDITKKKTELYPRSKKSNKLMKRQQRKRDIPCPLCPKTAQWITSHIRKVHKMADEDIKKLLANSSSYRNRNVNDTEHRERLFCPFEHCGCFVYDLNAHFKRKHGSSLGYSYSVVGNAQADETVYTILDELTPSPGSPSKSESHSRSFNCGGYTSARVNCTKLRKAAVTQIHDKHPDKRHDMASHMCHRVATAEASYRIVKKKTNSVACTNLLRNTMSNAGEPSCMVDSSYENAPSSIEKTLTSVEKSLTISDTEPYKKRNIWTCEDRDIVRAKFEDLVKQQLVPLKVVEERLNADVKLRERLEHNLKMTGRVLIRTVRDKIRSFYRSKYGFAR